MKSGHDALVAVSPAGQPEVLNRIVPVSELPPEVLRYTLPSRYCDSDKLLNLVRQNFGQITNLLQRVQTICDWGPQQHRIPLWFRAIRFVRVRGHRAPLRVCRDFAHAAIALCRAFNLRRAT